MRDPVRILLGVAVLSLPMAAMVPNAATAATSTRVTTTATATVAPWRAQILRVGSAFGLPTGATVSFAHGSGFYSPYTSCTLAGHTYRSFSQPSVNEWTGYYPASSQFVVQTDVDQYRSAAVAQQAVTMDDAEGLCDARVHGVLMFHKAWTTTVRGVPITVRELYVRYRSKANWNIQWYVRASSKSPSGANPGAAVTATLYTPTDEVGYGPGIPLSKVPHATVSHIAVMRATAVRIASDIATFGLSSAIAKGWKH
jgi:hypothetical protein